MAIKTTSESYFQRFPLLSIMGIIFCFVLFPLGMINLGLEQLMQTRQKNHEEEIAARFNSVLTTIERFNDNEYFSHFLLLNLNNRLLAAADPQSKFKHLKETLQRKYPDAFEFIYWDKNGNQVKELSDEKSYGYIIKKTFQLLKKASDTLNHWNEDADNLNLATLADLEKDLKILRNFLGKLLVTYQLRYPWMSGRLGKPLQTAPPGPRSRIWYRINEKFGFLCFINNEFIKSTAGIEFALNLTQKRFPEITAHISEFPAQNDSFFPPARAKITPDLIRALSNFENLSFKKIEKFGNFLIGCRLISQTSRAVCYCSADFAFSAQKERLFFLAKTGKIVFPLLFVALIWIKTRQKSLFSIRFKLIAIFLYAVGVPLLIMGSTGMEFLQQKKQQLNYETQSRGINILYTVDENFRTYLDDQATFLREAVENFNQNYGLKILEPEIRKIFRKRILALAKPESIQVFDVKGQSLVADTSRTIFSDYTISSHIAIEMLKVLNSRGNEPQGEIIDIAEKVTSDSVSKKKTINYVGLGSHELYHFYEVLGRPREYKNVAMVQLFWRLENLQRKFFEHFHQEKLVKTLPHGIKICAYYPDEDRLFTEISDVKLADLGQSAMQNQIVRRDNIHIGDQIYTAVAMRGLNLNKIAIIFLAPADQIFDEISSIQKRMILAAIIFLLLTLQMFRYLSRQFLSPVSEIEAAITSIDKRDFTYRLQIDSCLEFKELGETFNQTLETLKDLETAKIVQENLLPAQDFRLNNISLKAFSKPYSRIGGDYYDFFSLNSQQELIIFIGDVSGHGISAALIMAMAKSALIFERNNFSGFEELITRLDQIVYFNRQSGTKEYMTGLFLSLNSESGRVKIVNRGHCMPILFGATGEDARHIKCGGLPLGYNSKQKNQVIERYLSPGETLVLYTDGMAESHGKSGKSLGYEGFLEMLQQNWNYDRSVWLQKTLDAHLDWACQQDDDQTVIFAGYSGSTT